MSSWWDDLSSTITSKLQETYQEAQETIHELKESLTKEEQDVVDEVADERIASLVENDYNFLNDAPEDFEFSWNADIEKKSVSALKLYPSLDKLRFRLVPRKINEKIFWKNFWFRVHLIRNVAQSDDQAVEMIQKYGVKPPEIEENNELQENTSVEEQHVEVVQNISSEVEPIVSVKELKKDLLVIKNFISKLSSLLKQNKIPEAESMLEKAVEYKRQLGTWVSEVKDETFQMNCMAINDSLLEVLEKLNNLQKGVDAEHTLSHSDDEQSVSFPWEEEGELDD